MLKMLNKFLIILMIVRMLDCYSLPSERAAGGASQLHTIEGMILPPGPTLRVPDSWPGDVTLSINGGEYLGFVQSDGSFVISGVPYGTYVLYVYHADIYFQPIRLDVSHSGKVRARFLSYFKTSETMKLPYPLMLQPNMRRRYFRTREQWNILDYMLNPMVLLMVVPLILMLLLPRLINDPETKREIENIQFPKISTGVPDLSDVLTSFLTGKRPVENERKPNGGASNKKRN